jgi:hypothetical protein
MPSALLTLLVSGSSTIVLGLLGCWLVYFILDLLLVISVVKLYKGSGGLGSKRTVYVLAALSAACGSYFLSALEGGWGPTLLTASALPLLAALLAMVKATQPRAKS